MVRRTRRGSRGPRHVRLSAAPLVFVLALAVAVGPCAGGLRSQGFTPPGRRQAGPQPPTSTGPTIPPALPDKEGPPIVVPQSPVVVDPPPLPPPPVIFDGPAPPPVRFQITIDPKTPVKDLLPTPPKPKAARRRGPAKDLASVPELDFQAALAKPVTPEAAGESTAHMLAAINFLDGKKPDGFLLALRADRADLDGLPFAMGDACRTRGERSRQFTLAVASVRQAFQSVPGAGPQDLNAAAVQGVGERDRAAAFWEQYAAICAQQDRGASQIDRTRREDVTLARVAALIQILAPETPDLRLGLVKYLSGVPYAEATRALARLAVFSDEDEVRKAAVDALQVRRERDYTDVLVKGLRYPWPAVARRSADAVAKLGRDDLIPQLVGLLDEPDPRAPSTQEADGKSSLVVRELVRVNHHRNCMLCHSPGTGDGISQETLRAPVPLPTEALGTPANGYQSSSPDLLVRVDVTYLRQDFSLMQPVEDANPWPEMQRFDFLVRTRAVSDEEAADYREKLDKRDSDRPSPYQAAALGALRDLTGKDAAPTAEAWRRVLDLPAPQR